MNGGSKIVGLWGDTHPAQHAHTADSNDDGYAAEAEAPYGYDEDVGEGRGVAMVCALLALAWLGFVGWSAWAGWSVSAPPAPQIGAIVAGASAPLALIGVIYLLAMRTSRREARRFGATAQAMRDEAAMLEARITDLTARLDGNRAALADQADNLLALGEDSAHRLSAITAAMKGEAEAINAHAGALNNSAEAARADMAVLLSSLPKAQVQTRQMAASLQEAGMGALEQAGALEAQLSALIVRGREADEIASGAAQRLAAHLGRVEGTSENAGARLEEAAGRMNEAVDSALARASDAVDEARRGMETQGAAMIAMVEQSRAALARTSDDTAEQLARRISAIGAEVETIGTQLAAHDGTGHAMIAWLSNGLADIEARLAVLDESSVAKTERLGDAIAALATHADRMSGTLGTGGAAAETLIARAETLLTALDASAREIDETLPGALARLDAMTEASRSRIGAITPDMVALEKTAGATIDRLAQTERLLGQQREAIDLLSAASIEQLTSGQRNAEAMADALAAAETQSRSLADQSGPQLIEVMLRVRETANQAAERAREVMARIVPDAAEALGVAAEDAIDAHLSGKIEAHMAAIAGSAERAVDAANRASERLTAQMLTISETTAEIDTRFEAGRSAAEEANRETFARRVSLLIESLNSTAIDVTKILSNEITDSAWAAYLKGDRGVFTRRAVRLLDATEMREILRHYDEEPEFREQVNRYVHDFESMLRNVLASREGSPLGVTILSSDMGKLYVALAQAIERLRS